MRKWICLWVCLAFAISGCSKESSDDGSFSRLESLTDTQAADPATDPYTPYEQTVYYNLAKLTGLNNMPAGDTYEDNAITRYLLERLNIQNVDVTETDESRYWQTISMYIASRDLPDIMLVNSYSDLEYLVENDLIADLSEAYENTATDRIKEILNSYGQDLMDLITFDGKIMALPSTNVGNGASLFWVRQDWMDQLNLEAPKTVEDAIEIVRQFVLQNPGGSQEGENIGLAVNTELAGASGYDVEYSLDLIFQMFDAAPKQWIEQDGKLVYGSLTEECKEALTYLNQLYEEGILDSNFVLRSHTNVNEEVIAGRCGAFFGPWWSPNNPLADSLEEEDGAVWTCYALSNQEDGSLSYYEEQPASMFVVVRKDFEYPELIFKMVSVEFDELRFENKTEEEINAYEKDNVDQTARPLAINIDYYHAVQNSFENIQGVLEGSLSEEEVPILDASYAKACQEYLADPQNASASSWAAYASRVMAPQALSQMVTKEKRSLYFGIPDSASSSYSKLLQMENEAFIKIIMGQEDISYFDTFKEQWYAAGGLSLLQEAAADLEMDWLRL